LCRQASVSVVESYHFDDGCESYGTDTFMREPFVVMFSSRYTGLLSCWKVILLPSLILWQLFNKHSLCFTTLSSFTLIPQHTSPELAVEEINALYDVVTDIRTRWNTNNIVLLGDFNSGCSYVTASDWQKIRLFTDKSFHWLIPDSADTTVIPTNCPYDRVVVTADMLKGVVHGSAQVFDFVADLNLSQSMVKASPLEGLAISDHFPVEVKLTS
ncbi:deoxyribonuclease-1-like, partial [Girardinichthys multiradiatus]|uniref:deoxyribonuclease-1-like n=1 Tax=Girardinichthys multiradiatus TaxID=208333 RepID=UPI001FACF809